MMDISATFAPLGAVFAFKLNHILFCKHNLDPTSAHARQARIMLSSALVAARRFEPMNESCALGHRCDVAAGPVRRFAREGGRAAGLIKSLPWYLLGDLRARGRAPRAPVSGLDQGEYRLVLSVTGGLRW